jgi:hypothetical protein
MTAIELLAKLLADTYNGDAWHGPSLAVVIDGTSTELASKKINDEIHTITELVHHSAYWMGSVRCRLTGEPFAPNQNISWGPSGLDAETNWRIAKESLEAEYKALHSAIEKFPEDKLSEPFMEGGVSFFGLINGAIHHNLWHAGQIALIKKL